MSGGQRTSRHVNYYDVKTDSWSSLPWMNYARWFHASCSLGDFVFVFCGLSLHNHNRIESIDCTKIAIKTAVWNNIQVPETDLEPRSDLAAVPVSKH